MDKNGICCAPNIREDYLTNKGWDFKCIPNGSSMPVWKYNDDEKSKYRKEFGLKEGMKYFIFISRFSQEKNPDIIIHAFRLLDRSDIGLVMLGKYLCGMSLKTRKYKYHNAWFFKQGL